MSHLNSVTAPSFNSDFQEFVEVQEYSADTSMQDYILNSAWSPFFNFAFFVSLLIIIGIIYTKIRLSQVRAAEDKFYKEQPISKEGRKLLGLAGNEKTAGSAHEGRWRGVMTAVSSENPNDWRQAVMEADIMLDDVITSKGYIGDGVGEKMKQVQKGDINSIDDAWEAHKVRNRIAHDGADFDLSQREAKRAIGLYEKVFKELGYI
ncbi:hypothetical protein COB52_01225 [Candidatus Kaiserbacteria bacterium]|nr:MAG: hypothetical protein COB52_01225 [Candidatus Kaiserbacteria bacterium]